MRRRRAPSRRRICRRCVSHRRFSRPDGKPFGIVIINVDMRPALFRVRSSMRPGETIYVVNAAATISSTPIPPANSARSSAADQLAGRLSRISPRRSAHAKHGPNRHGSSRAAGRRGARARHAGRQANGSVSSKPFPNAVFMAPAAAIRNTSMLVGLIAVLGAAALAVFVAQLADPADPSIDGGRRRHRQERPASPFPSTRAARPACWRGRSRA